MNYRRGSGNCVNPGNFVKSPEGSIERSVVREGGLDKSAGHLTREINPESKREVSNLAFMSVAGATRELQYLKLSNPEKYGSMSLDQIRQHKLSEDIGNRDKMSFMSVAICNPFFLLGLGAAFAVMDEIRGLKEGKLQKAVDGRNGGLRHPSDTTVGGGSRRLVKGETIEETEAKAKALKPKSLTPEAIKMLGLDKRTGAASDTSYLKYGLKKVTDQSRPPAARAEVSEKVKQKLFTGVEASWEERAAARSLKNWIKTDQLIKKKQALGDQMERLRGREQYSVVAGLAAKIELVDKALKRQGV